MATDHVSTGQDGLIREFVTSLDDLFVVHRFVMVDKQRKYVTWLVKLKPSMVELNLFTWAKNQSFL